MTYAAKCWACGSSNFKETVSKEECLSCGIICDYWGAGANDKYLLVSETKHYVEELEREKEQDDW